LVNETDVVENEEENEKDVLNHLMPIIYYGHYFYFIKIYNMPRPCKKRILKCNPEIKFFKPVWVPLKSIEISEIKLDEYESIKLSNIDNLSMEEWAKKMWISAPTFNRILQSAHKKIADAIVNGKGIMIK